MRPAILLLLLPLAVSAQPLVLEGELPDDGADFVLVPFQGSATRTRVIQAERVHGG